MELKSEIIVAKQTCVGAVESVDLASVSYVRKTKVRMCGIFDQRFHGQ